MDITPSRRGFLKLGASGAVIAASQLPFLKYAQAAGEETVVVVMGQKAGHLALGIGKAEVPEFFTDLPTITEGGPPTPAQAGAP